jgi:thermitase
VGFEPDATRSEQLAAIDDVSAPAQAVASIPQIDSRVIVVPDADVTQTLAQLRRDGDVEFASVDTTMRAAWMPNDPMIGQQWLVSLIGMPEAWDVTRGSSDVIFADVDSGVDASHPDLAGRVLPGRDFVANDYDARDEHGHGTHVAGIAAASANNSMGVAGVAPSVKILPVRVLNASGSGYSSGVAAGIVWAADQGADVINLSLGSASGASEIAYAVDYAASKGAVVVCAAGNDSRGSLSYPARYDACLSVGATTSTDDRASFSNYGTGIDVVAPGQSILSTTPGNQYASWSGTSMASPVVSGVAALLASKGLNRSQIINAIQTTAKDLGAAGYDTVYGHGRVDAARALGAPVTTPPPATTTPPPTTTTPPPPPTTTQPAPPAPNSAPVCQRVVLNVIGRTSGSVQLRCTDKEKSPLTYRFAVGLNAKWISINPTTGVLTFTAPRGATRGRFTLPYVASDGSKTSTPGYVTVMFRAR